MIINHNISGLNSARQFQMHTRKFDRSLERLSSGLRINRGMDGPADLAISEKMRSQIRGLKAASRNAQDGISFLQTAEGWLNESAEILQRMRETSIQMSNGLYGKEDRELIKVEMNQLIDEFDRIAEQAEYNGMSILKGGFRNPKGAGEEGVNQSEGGVNEEMMNEGEGISLHIGANYNERVKVFIGNMSSSALGLTEGEGESRKLSVDYSTQDGANESIQKLDSALNIVNREKANIGAYQMRLEMVSRSLEVASENIQAAESRIRDTNIAEEMVEYVKSKILLESSAALSSQANIKPLVAIRLLERSLFR